MYDIRGADLSTSFAPKDFVEASPSARNPSNCISQAEQFTHGRMEPSPAPKYRKGNSNTLTSGVPD